MMRYMHIWFLVKIVHSVGVEAKIGRLQSNQITSQSQQFIGIMLFFWCACVCVRLLLFFSNIWRNLKRSTNKIEAIKIKNFFTPQRIHTRTQSYVMEIFVFIVYISFTFRIMSLDILNGNLAVDFWFWLDLASIAMV